MEPDKIFILQYNNTFIVLIFLRFLKTYTIGTFYITPKIEFLLKKIQSYLNSETMVSSCTLSFFMKKLDRYVPAFFLIFDECEDFRKKFEEIIRCANKNDFSLNSVSKIFRNRKEIVLAAVSNLGYALQYAGPNARNHPEVVKAAVSNYGYALEYASKERRNDKEVVLAAVSNLGYALQYASKERRNDKEVVLAAIKNIRYSIQYASSELQKDRDVLNCCFEERPNGFGNVLYLRTLLSRS